MSLKARVLAAEQAKTQTRGTGAGAMGAGSTLGTGGALGAVGGPGMPSPTGVAGAAGAADRSPGRDKLCALKQQVQRYVSVDDLAAMLAQTPVRARNELRSACARVFASVEWAGTSESQRAHLVERLIDEVFGFGPLEPLLADEAITEIMVNGPASVFYEKNGVLCKSHVAFTSFAQLRALIDRVLGPLGRRVDEAQPMVSARMPEGHRVNVVMPPLAIEGPVVTIRKFTARVLRLADLQRMGSFDANVAKFLRWAVCARKSIAVSGGTGSGKTTLLNALSCELPKAERIITIEDSAELRFFEHPHVVRLEARQESAEGTGRVSIRDLVINALRMRPDRIVVGECRGEEALDMLTAMNTGHDGSLTTLHANSSKDAVARLTTMVRYAVDLPVDVIEANVASAFDVVVQTARSLSGVRYIAEIAEFNFNYDVRACEVRPVYVRKTPEEAGRWLAVPAWVVEGKWPGASSEEVLAWQQAIGLAA